MLRQAFREIKQTLKTPGFWLLAGFDSCLNIYTACQNFDPILFILALITAIGATILYYCSSKG